MPDDFAGRRLFPDDNWWNLDISNAPVDPQSSAYIDYVGRTRASHPDFGPPPYGELNPAFGALRGDDFEVIQLGLR